MFKFTHVRYKFTKCIVDIIKFYVNCLKIWNCTHIYKGSQGLTVRKVLINSKL